VVLMEKDPEWGFPRRLGIYEIAEPQKTGHEYRAAVIPLKEAGLQIQSTMFGPKAATERSARDLAIRGLHILAERLKLEVQIRTEKSRK